MGSGFDQGIVHKRASQHYFLSKSVQQYYDNHIYGEGEHTCTEIVILGSLTKLDWFAFASTGTRSQ
jgi:hypothetical protein